MKAHVVASYDEELKFIVRRISEMGGQAERIVEQAVVAVIRRDKGLAQSVIADDVALNAAQRQVEELAMLTIAEHQPIAGDLREIVGAIRVSNDLKRIGNLGRNVAKRMVATRDHSHPDQLVRGMEHFSKLVLGQLEEVLDAYVERDECRAVHARDSDDDIDAMYMSIFRELLTYMMEDPRNISSCTYLLFSAKNIERIGDHAMNIAEMVYYIRTGSYMDADRAKDDRTSSVALPLGNSGLPAADAGSD